MKIDWKSESFAALSAFALTGVALWGSIVPLQAVPVLPRDAVIQAGFAPVATTALANTYRAGDRA